MAGLVATVRLSAIWSGWIDGELTLADDAFYYFQIARHVAQGLGPTFDGLAPTNGFHPLYLVGLSLLYRIWGASPWIPIHASLSCLLACDLVSAWLLYRIGHRWSPRAGIGAAIVWLTCPLAIATSQRGMESALSTSLVLAGVMAYLRWLDHPREFGRSVLLGICLGLAVLARTENGLIVFSVGLAAIVLRRRAVARLCLNAGVPFAALLGPWLLWQWRTFGTWEQSSGAAIRILNIYGHLDFGGQPPWNPLAFAHQFRDVLEWLHRCALTQEFEPLGPMAAAYFGLSIAALVVSLAGGLYLWWRNRRRVVAAPLAPFVVYAVLHFVYYFAVVRTYRPWYHLTLVAGVILLGTFAIDHLLGRRFFWTLLIAWVGVQAVAVCVYTVRGAWFETTRTAEQRVEWIERNCGATANVGMMNAGKLGYLAGFRSRLTIVNLDGVVNNKVLEAYRRGTFPQYYCTTLDYILELPGPQVFQNAPLRSAFEDFAARCIRELPTRPIPVYSLTCEGCGGVRLRPGPAGRDPGASLLPPRLNGR